MLDRTPVISVYANSTHLFALIPVEKKIDIVASYSSALNYRRPTLLVPLCAIPQLDLFLSPVLAHVAVEGLALFVGQ
jgi:hypothetical protein